MFFLVRFTKKPLRFFGMIGAIMFGARRAAHSAQLVVERLFFGQALADRPALLLSSLLVVLGLQLFALGLLGELIIFTHAREIKDYQVERIVRFPGPAAERSESAVIADRIGAGGNGVELAPGWQTVPRPRGRGDNTLCSSPCSSSPIAGVYARFKGLGTWPLGIDEYYVARSDPEHIARRLSGVCVRWVLHTRLTGAVPGLSSAARRDVFRAFPAAHRSVEQSPPVAGRVYSRAKGWRTAHRIACGDRARAVRMGSGDGRFARMYAPFQALFAWYTVYFIRYTVDREARAVWPMLGLSLVGTFVWEGGVLLAVTNLLPPLFNARSGAWAPAIGAISPASLAPWPCRCICSQLAICARLAAIRHTRRVFRNAIRRHRSWVSRMATHRGQRSRPSSLVGNCSVAS